MLSPSTTTRQESAPPCIRRCPMLQAISTRDPVRILWPLLLVTSLALLILVRPLPYFASVAYADTCGPNSTSGPQADPCTLTSTMTSNGAVIQISQPVVDRPSFDYNSII